MVRWSTHVGSGGLVVGLRCCDVHPGDRGIAHAERTHVVVGVELLLDGWGGEAREVVGVLGGREVWWVERHV